MLTFQYTARNPSTGEKVKATVQAENQQSAAKLIRRQGFVPIVIDLEHSRGFGAAISKRFNRVRTKDKVLFARQLSTLINAGLPLLQSLRSVAEQTTSKPLKVVINDTIGSVEGGQAFSTSLAKYPDLFNQVFIGLVTAGETSGTLDAALERIAIQQEKDADIVSKVRGAMIYPLVVLLVMLLVVTFMLVKVLPQVKVLYKTFPGATLPFETRALLSLSSFVIHFWWLIIVFVIALLFGGSRWIHTVSGRRLLDTVKLRMPPINKLFQKMYMARFARTSATLVASGVPLLQVLQITSNAISNVLERDSIMKAAEKVKGGKALSDSLEGDPNFLPLVPNMLRIGEQSGSMEQMMGKVADYYEKEVDDEISNVSSIIEPVMMVLLGVIALVIVAAVLLPVYGLAASGAVSGGGI